MILVLRAENDGGGGVTQKISININSERALQTVACCVHMGGGVVGEEAGLGSHPILIPFGSWIRRVSPSYLLIHRPTLK